MSPIIYESDNEMVKKCLAGNEQAAVCFVYTFSPVPGGLIISVCNAPGKMYFSPLELLKSIIISLVFTQVDLKNLMG
jgi:hypothetical protein